MKAAGLFQFSMSPSRSGPSIVSWIPVLMLVLLVSTASAQMPQPGDDSYFDKANRALTAGDYATAVDLYRKWLEANPNDYISWYNYASALSLRGNHELALTAFENSIIAGFRDSIWVANDPDLDPVRNTDRFANLMKTMSERARIEATLADEGNTPLFIPQSRLAPYKLFLPHDYDNKKRPYPVIILLHGRTGDMDTMNDLRTRLALPDVIYVQPQAPYSLGDASTGYEYWPRTLVRTSKDSMLFTAQTLSAKWVTEVARQVSGRVRVDTSRVFVAGFGQGGTTALLAALNDPSLFRGTAALAGYLPEDHQDTTAIRELSYEGTSAFIAHGRQDRAVKPAEAEKVQVLFKNAGVITTFKLYPARHEMSDEMVLDLAEWIMETSEGPRMRTVRPEASVRGDSLSTESAIDQAVPAEIDSVKE